MCVHGISGLLGSVSQWPWATIIAVTTAFAGVAAAWAALYVGRSEIKDRRRQLGRETVAQVASAVQNWNEAAVGVLFRRTSETNIAARREYRRVTGEVAKVLLVAHMACDDDALKRYLDEIDVALQGFSNHIRPDSLPPDETPDEHDRTVLKAWIDGAATAGSGFLSRAVLVYGSNTPRRLPEWLRDEPRQT